MTKNRRLNNKELDQLQTLKKENSELKKQISSLRKQLSRVDIDRYENLTDIIDQLYEEEKILAHKTLTESKEALKKKWQCFDCEVGHLRLLIVNRPDGPHYLRKCDNCPKKTKWKKYTKDIEGIIE